MKWLAYLLLLLLFSAQVDETWGVTLGSPSASPAADNDEYLPAQPRREVEPSTSRQEPLFGLKPQTADGSIARRSVPGERNHTPPAAPPPLYAFMSLRI
jgi:hypothetical protein